MPATECRGASTTACSSVVNSATGLLSDGVATAFEPGAEVDGTANMMIWCDADIGDVG